MRQIRLLLADDLTLVRHGIRVLMSRVEGVEIVGEAATADDAVDQAKALLPHVVLLDEDLPGESLRATRAIKDAIPQVEVIVTTDRLDYERALQAIEAGAAGYIFKDIPPDNLASAIRSVTNGRARFHREDTRRLLERVGHLTCARGRSRLTFDGLTDREIDILTQLAHGSTDREVAAELVVAEGTVKTHVRNVLRKLGARNRTQAVAHALRRRLIT
ncbi:MAG: LuxR C-terminal-related transcriptional regulator [Armatimonadota bacterium]